MLLAGPSSRKLSSLGFIGHMLRANPVASVVVTVTTLLLSAIDGIGLSLLLPLFQAIGIDSGAQSDGPAQMVMKGFAILGIPTTLEAVLIVTLAVAVFQIALFGVQRRLIGVARQQLVYGLRTVLFDMSGRASWGFLLKQHSGHTVNAIVTECARVGLAYGSLLTSVGLILIFVCYVGLAAWITWQFTLALGLVGGLSGLLVQKIYRRSRNAGAASTAAHNRLQEVVNEHMAAGKLIRAMGAQDYSSRLFTAAAAAVERHLLVLDLNEARVKLVVEPLAVAMLMAIIYVSVSVMGLAAGELVVLLALFYRLIPRLVQLQQQFQNVAANLPTFEHLREMAGRLDQAREVSGSRIFDRLERGVELIDVCVSYREQPVFTGIDLHIPARKTVVLIGKSGGGKTTLLDVLLGLRRVDGGAVLLDGVPFEEFDVESFRRRLAVVQQDSSFFHDTIANNLRLAAPDATDAEIWQALEDADAATWVRATPDGLETVLGDQAARISGGQRQRLAIARALLRDPEILILDEPTSALDNDSETAICNMLMTLAGRMTILIVTHRPAMLDVADMVFSVGDGTITKYQEAVDGR